MIPSVALLLAVLIPLAFAVLSILGYVWWIRRDKRRSPLSGKLQHSAGEQLRARMQEHGDDMMGAWMLMLMSGPLFMLAWALQFVPWRHAGFGVREAIFILGAVVLFALGLRSFLHHAGLRRQAREGLAAERMTAQELNHLIGSGCQVLHDIPGEGFNLDHVVVGPRGVIMIETKSRKKPPKEKDDSHYKVQYDGEGLLFAGARRPTAQPSPKLVIRRNGLHATCARPLVAMFPSFLRWRCQDGGLTW